MKLLLLLAVILRHAHNYSALYIETAAPEHLSCVHSIREQRRSVTVLLAGTSGTGKSTLAGGE